MRRHLESNLQKNCVYWFRLQYPQFERLLFSVPNGGKRNAREAAILKAEGTVSGVSDLILLVPSGGYSSLCIEMKHGKGKQTDNQIAWQKAAEKFGNKYVVCRSIEEFIDTIKSYLKNSFFD